MVPPKYIISCVDVALLSESMEAMLETITANLDSGYQIDIDIVTHHIQDGMTIETFNMLAFSLNKELRTQFDKNDGSYGVVTNDMQPSIH